MKRKKFSIGRGLEPENSTPKFNALMTTPLGSQLPYLDCYHIIYVTQEETYIRRMSSEEEAKAELGPKPNSNVMFACLAQSWLSLTVRR